MTNSRAAQQEAQDRALRRPGMSAKNRANVLMGAIGVWLLISWHLAVWITSRGMAFTDVGASWGTLLRYLLDALLGGITGNEDAPSSPLDLGPGIEAGNPLLVGLVLLVLLAFPVAGLILRATRRQRRRVAREGRDGMVSSDALQRRLQGPKGLAAAAPFEPSARYENKDIRFRAEDTVSCAAIPRQGKSAYLTVGEVVDAPGAVITTSTKVDVFRLTAHARSQRGTVWLFDPEGVSLWPERAHWNVVSGCEAAKVAMDRSRSMAAAMPLGDRNQFFEEAAGTVLRCLLHAAALSGATMREVVRWATW